MSGSFLRRLLGGSSPPTPGVAEALADLDRLAADRPALRDPAGTLRAVLAAAFAEPVPSPTFALRPDAARQKIEAGIPVLRDERLGLDNATLRDRARAVCEGLRAGPDNGPSADLAAALRRGDFEAAELLHDVLAGRPDAVPARAEALGLDPALAATVLRFTALPVLARIDLVAHLAAVRWDRGYCPGCGGWPLLAEYRGLEQLRILRCGWCAAGWEFPRLRCPLCDCRDHRQLAYLHVETEPDRYRATTCDQCHGYVKGVTALAAIPPPGLLVADLVTVHLDLAAADRGFQVR